MTAGLGSNESWVYEIVKGLTSPNGLALAALGVLVYLQTSSLKGIEMHLMQIEQALVLCAQGVQK